MFQTFYKRCSSALFFAELEKNSCVKLQAKNTAPAAYPNQGRIADNKTL